MQNFLIALGIVIGMVAIWAVIAWWRMRRLERHIAVAWGGVARHAKELFVIVESALPDVTVAKHLDSDIHKKLKDIHQLGWSPDTYPFTAIETYRVFAFHMKQGELASVPSRNGLMVWVRTRDALNNLDSERGSYNRLADLYNRHISSFPSSTIALLWKRGPLIRIERN